VSAALARQLFEMGIRDERVLWAVGQVPRRLFVPPALRDQAEADRPLPIGHGQTISQPYIGAFMTELLALLGREKVLEIGTGSGYQTAVLALLAAKVDSVEIVPELSARAAELLLATLALPNVHLRVADGAGGWPEEAPFDRILVTAAPGTLPPALVDQLATGGRMVVPVGEEEGVQVLKTVEKGPDGRVTARDIIPVRFVPLRTGTPLLS
jgi:protein-L-isoaspartate(D-aspartate) O-methyltransferase